MGFQHFCDDVIVNNKSENHLVKEKIKNDKINIEFIFDNVDYPEIIGFFDVAQILNGKIHIKRCGSMKVKEKKAVKYNDNWLIFLKIAVSLQNRGFKINKKDIEIIDDSFNSFNPVSFVEDTFIRNASELDQKKMMEFFKKQKSQLVFYKSGEYDILINLGKVQLDSSFVNITVGRNNEDFNDTLLDFNVDLDN